MLDNYHDILTVDELMEILFISRNTAYSLLRNGSIHAIKVGKNWRIPKVAVEEYVNEKSSLRLACI